MMMATTRSAISCGRLFTSIPPHLSQQIRSATSCFDIACDAASRFRTVVVEYAGKYPTGAACFQVRARCPSESSFQADDIQPIIFVTTRKLKGLYGPARHWTSLPRSTASRRSFSTSIRTTGPIFPTPGTPRRARYPLSGPDVACGMCQAADGSDDACLLRACQPQPPARDDRLAVSGVSEPAGLLRSQQPPFLPRDVWL